MVRKIKRDEFDFLVKKYTDLGYSLRVAKGIVRNRLKQITISNDLICPLTPSFPM